MLNIICKPIEFVVFKGDFMVCIVNSFSAHVNFQNDRDYVCNFGCTPLQDHFDHGKMHTIVKEAMFFYEYTNDKQNAVTKAH